jgi:steroid 5-alpha reductase family enzyme
MNLTTLFLLGGAAILAIGTAVWLVSLLIRNSSIIDIFWSILFLAAGGVYYVFGEATGLRSTLLYAVMLLWGVRLALHILVRAVGKPEDKRYAAWRAEAGSSWWWKSYFKVFLLQGAIAWALTAPMLYALAVDSTLSWAWHDIAGFALFGLGFFFEAVGDAQLAAFKRNPDNSGKVMDRGLWALTRHPNYFGDAVLWWGFWLIALPVAPLWTIFAPIIMTWLLVRVSGVKMLDEILAKEKPGYAEYMERVSGFVPWPKRGNR